MPCPQVTFLAVIIRKSSRGKLLASSGYKLGIPLNILTGTGQPSTTKNFLAQHVWRSRVNKLRILVQMKHDRQRAANRELSTWMFILLTSPLLCMFEPFQNQQVLKITQLWKPNHWLEMTQILNSGDSQPLKLGRSLYPNWIIWIS